MNREQTLIATIRAYHILAVKLKSKWYCQRVRETYQLLRAERELKTKAMDYGQRAA